MRAGVMIRKITARIGICSFSVIGLALACTGGCAQSTTVDGIPISLPGAVFSMAVGEFSSDADVFENGVNSSFSQANSAPLTPGQTLLIAGEISSLDDVDMFNVGPLEAGTRITVDVNGVIVDTQVTLFDENGEFFAFNDDRNFEEGNIDPLIDHVLRYSTTATYIAVEMDFGAKLSENHNLSGYEIHVTAEPGEPIPPTQPQNLVINFEGSSFVAIKDFYYGPVPVFDPYLIHMDYEGLRDVFINEIMQKVRDDFAGYNVFVYRSTDADVPWPNVSTIHVGGANPGLFGIANNVDDYNAVTVEEGIVYAESFAALIRNNNAPSTMEMAQAIANVVTHEAGHLLGLHHTILNPVEIMQTTSTSEELMLDEAFGTTRLDNHGVGKQNARKRLLQSVGGSTSVLSKPLPNLKPYIEAARHAQATNATIFEKSLFGSCRCGQCTTK